VQRSLSHPRRLLLSILCPAILLAMATTILWPRLWGGAAPKRAHAAGTYSSPLTINDSNYGNGTFSGSWESTNPDIPAVTVLTSKPVTIINSQVRGPGILIDAPNNAGHSISVIKTSGYGTNPNIAGRAKDAFVHGDLIANLLVDQCSIEGTAYGVTVNEYTGDKTTNQTIKILHNIVHNIDGRNSDGNGGYQNTGSAAPHFVITGDVRGVPGMEVAWNQVINDPGNSDVNDVSNFYQTSGTSNSNILVHDNYIQGAYAIDPVHDGYSGGGIITDGAQNNTVDTATAFVNIYNNQIISTTNYGIAIAAGHDNAIHDNRIISAGVLPDGTPLAAQNVGTYVANGANQANSVYFNDHSYNNTIGWFNPKDGNQRNDMYFPGDDGDYGRNTVLPNPITLDTEKAEFPMWQQKLSSAGITVGAPTASSSPSAFFNDFENGSADQWTAQTGTWTMCVPAMQGATHEYCATDRNENISFAGESTWSNYQVEISVLATSSAVNSGIAVLGRVQDASHYYEAELKQLDDGSFIWDISKNDGGTWTLLTSGGYNWSTNHYYTLRLDMNGGTLTASLSSDLGQSYQTLGTTTDSRFTAGEIGLRAWGGTVGSFDVVRVTQH